MNTQTFIKIMEVISKTAECAGTQKPFRPFIWLPGEKAHTERVSLWLRRSRLEALESPRLAGGSGKPEQWGRYHNKILEETCAELPAEGDSESAGSLVDPKAVEPHLPHL